VKKLVKTVHDLPWMPKPCTARLYITDQVPPMEQCATAFGLTFRGEDILLTRLVARDWDLPGGAIDPGETPEEAAVREVLEETAARVRIVELIGIQETVIEAPKPENYKWPYPVSVQVYYLTERIELLPFEANMETRQRRFFTPKEARRVPTMNNHDLIYEEALKRI
jgi:8-oxo-dGTP diphosphatase